MSGRQDGILARSKTDQKKLLARLYRSNGEDFDGAVNRAGRQRGELSSAFTPAPPAAAAAAAVGSKRPSPPGGPVLASTGRGLSLSHAKRRKALQRDLVAENRGMDVGVPPSLQPLVGEALNIRTAGKLSPKKRTATTTTAAWSQSSLSTELVTAAGGELALVGSGAVNAPPRPSSSMSASSTESRAEYEKYINSPFAFIDKVIESPYTKEFVYLEPRGPYDLRIVRHDEIDPLNYYTMSRAGVTHFYQTDTDFTSLDQWEREYFLYTKMMEVPFFKKFRMWKAFSFWRKLIRRTKSNKYRKYLTENLYILNPYLRGSLIELRNICYNASKWTLFKLDEHKTATLTAFMEAQDAQQTSVMETLSRMQLEVRQIVLRACEVDLREFLVNNGFRKSKSRLPQTDEEAAEEGYLQKISHAEKAAIRTKCRKLTKYIRLADYFIVDTLVTLSMDRTADLLEFMTSKERQARLLQQAAEAVAAEEAAIAAGTLAPEDAQFARETVAGMPGKRGAKERKKEDVHPLICTDVVIHGDESELSFEPTLQTIQQCVEEAIIGVVKAAMSPKRLLKDAEFLQYTQVNNDDDDDDDDDEAEQEMLVLHHESFIDTVQDVKAALAAAFQ
jgi:dynein heavy chain